MLTIQDEAYLTRLQRKIKKGEAALAALYAERDAAIEKLRDAGATFDAIGVPLGLTRVRIRSICAERKGGLQVEHPPGKVGATSK